MEEEKRRYENGFIASVFLKICNYASSAGCSDVQCGQRVASIAISLLQNGQTLVVGASGSSFFLPSSEALLIALMIQNKTKAVMIK